MKLDPKTKGIFLVIIAGLFFACMSACVRLAGDLPTPEKAFFRNIVAVVPSFLALRRDKTPVKIPKGTGKYILIRAICGTVGILCNYYAIDHINLADSNMLNKMSPIYAVVFSYFILKEKVTVPQVLVVIGAFCASLLVIKPTGANLVLIPTVLAAIGGVAAGLAYTTLRYATTHGVPKPMLVLAFSGFSCLVMLPLMAFDPVMPTLRQLIILFICGVFGAAGQFFITAAYTCAPAHDISVYEYIQILFAAILGFVMFGQQPDVFSLIGYVLVIGLGVLNFMMLKKRKSGELTAPAGDKDADIPEKHV